MSAFGLCSLLTSIHLEPQEIISFRTASFHTAFPRGLGETHHPKVKVAYNAVLQSYCTLSPLPKESSLKLENAKLKDVGILGLEIERPFMVSFGNYMVREAVLDEEYWCCMCCLVGSSMVARRNLY
eukprot:c16585_g1_i2 orf=170-547(+)